MLDLLLMVPPKHNVALDCTRTIIRSKKLAKRGSSTCFNCGSSSEAQKLAIKWVPHPLLANFLPHVIVRAHAWAVPYLPSNSIMTGHDFQAHLIVGPGVLQIFSTYAVNIKY